MIVLWRHGAVRKLVAIALLGILLSCLWLGMAAPALSLIESTEDRLSDSLELKMRLEARIASLQAQLDADANDEVPALPLWQEVESGAAEIAVQQAVRSMAIGAELQLGSLSQRAVRSNSDPLAIGLSIEARGPYDRILRLLHAIERHEPLIHVDRLSLRTLPGISNETRFPVLRLQLELSAHLSAEKVRG